MAGLFQSKKDEDMIDVLRDYSKITALEDMVNTVSGRKAASDLLAKAYLLNLFHYCHGKETILGNEEASVNLPDESLMGKVELSLPLKITTNTNDYRKESRQQILSENIEIEYIKEESEGLGIKFKISEELEEACNRTIRGVYNLKRLMSGEEDGFI